MKKHLLIPVIMLLAALSILSACGSTGTPTTGHNPATNLMTNIEIDHVQAPDTYIDAKAKAAYADFAVRIFQQSMTDESTLVSPLSVITAIGMAANGADGETLAQMEKVFGITAAELNSFLAAYSQNLPQGEKYKLNPANSIWIKDAEYLTVEEQFLSGNALYYNADIYKAAFDKNTVQEINQWIEEKTDGMIKDMLSELPKNAVLCLINALAFDAEWQDIYEDHLIREGTFTNINGKKQKVDMMYSAEGTFIHDENAKGFVKYYKGGQYAFAALLPNEDVELAEYAKSLSGSHLQQMLAEPSYIAVDAAIPKFESESLIKMNDILSDMGMPLAFDEFDADFSRMAHSDRGNIYITDVLHKTFISVDQAGTKAGAATVVLAGDCAAADPQLRETVYLDRPFVYMLIDCENNLPIFIGTLTDVK